MILLFGLPIYNVDIPKTINKTTPVTVTPSDTTLSTKIKNINILQR